MKRFLTLFLCGVVLIAAGVTTLVFELKSFAFEEIQVPPRQSVLLENCRRLTFFQGDMGSTRWDYDDTMKDGEVLVETYGQAVCRQEEDTIEIYYEHTQESWKMEWQIVEQVLDGLKQQKLSVFVPKNAVVITSNHVTKEAMSFQFRQDEHHIWEVQ